jgi:hypothetical protein
MTAARKTQGSGAIERETCLDLLERAPLARVVISVKCLPVALPARISLIERDHLLLASADPAVRQAAERNDVLSIQIDGLDDDGMIWSVMVSVLGSVAPDGEPLSLPLQDAIGHGATLVMLPLSVVVGQHG